jgi:hypothetical protein
MFGVPNVIPLPNIDILTEQNVAEATTPLSTATPPFFDAGLKLRNKFSRRQITQIADDP